MKLRATLTIGLGSLFFVALGTTALFAISNGVDRDFLRGYFQGRRETPPVTPIVEQPPTMPPTGTLPTEPEKFFKRFVTQTYAAGLNQPVSLAFGPAGELYVTQLGGEVRVFSDTNGDAKADRSSAFATGFDSPLGVLAHGGYVYIGSKTKVTRLKDTNSDLKADERRDIITGLPSGRHQTDSLAVGPDGKLYISQGSRSDHGERAIHPLEASILRANLNGSGLTVFAKGLRNPFDLAFHPDTGELFATDNGRDVPTRGVSEELNVVKKGGDYGWPDCWDRGEGTNCAGTIFPIALMQEHSSADGMAFYTGTQFPKEYKNNLLVALYGANSGDPAIGKRLERVQLTRTASGAWQAKVTTFARNFQHPLDIAVGPKDGYLYVTDFGAGTVVTIRAEYK